MNMLVIKVSTLSNQGAFLVGEIMNCKYGVMQLEHPTSGACRHMKFCKKYNQYCFNQCKEQGHQKTMN